MDRGRAELNDLRARTCQGGLAAMKHLFDLSEF
jgi:hypothetical protein